MNNSQYNNYLNILKNKIYVDIITTSTLKHTEQDADFYQDTHR